MATFVGRPFSASGPIVSVATFTAAGVIAAVMFVMAALVCGGGALGLMTFGQSTAGG